MVFARQNSAYQSVYRVVEEVSAEGPFCAGHARAIFTAIDDLRRMQAPREDVGLAERIAVAMHKLEWAIRSREAAAQDALRCELKSLGANWLERPIGRH